jgi:hypothetical protein
VNKDKIRQNSATHDKTKPTQDKTKTCGSWVVVQAQWVVCVPSVNDKAAATQQQQHSNKRKTKKKRRFFVFWLLFAFAFFALHFALKTFQVYIYIGENFRQSTMRKKDSTCFDLAFPRSTVCKWSQHPSI